MKTTNDNQTSRALVSVQRRRQSAGRDQAQVTPVKTAQVVPVGQAIERAQVTPVKTAVDRGAQVTPIREALADASLPNTNERPQVQVIILQPNFKG